MHCIVVKMIIGYQVLCISTSFRSVLLNSLHLLAQNWACSKLTKRKTITTELFKRLFTAIKIENEFVDGWMDGWMDESNTNLVLWTAPQPSPRK